MITRVFAVASGWAAGFFTSSVVLDLLQGRSPQNVGIAVTFSIVALGLLPHD